MGSSPLPLVLPDGVQHITPFDLTSIAACLGNMGTPTNEAWPAQYRAIFFPVRVSRPVKLAYAFWWNGSPASGLYSIDVGVYSADLTNLGSTGLTAEGTAATIQTVALTTQFGPGLFYIAMTHNYTKPFFAIITPITVSDLRAVGCFQMALSSPYSLPATATVTAISSAYIPTFGVTVRSFV